MSNQNEFVTGDVAPAYLQVNIHTKESLAELEKLPDYIQRAYFHELIHYLQYNTTGYGLYYFWHVYDRLRQMLASLPQDKKPIEIPLLSEVQKEQLQLEDVFSKVRGSAKLPARIHPLAAKYYEIKEIVLDDDSTLNKHFPHHQVGHVRLILRNAGGDEAPFRFGETAVAETMVRLIECKHYGADDRFDRFPYFVAEDVAKFVYPVVGNNPELVFALCDVSMMHPLPGWAFYHLLEQMKKDNSRFTTGEEVNRYGLKNFALENWRIPYREEDALHGINTCLDKLYDLKEFEPTKIWVKTVIENGFEFRANNPYFFIKMFREKPFTGTMNIAWKTIGGPHCINDNFVRHIRLPEILENKDLHYVDQVYPQRLRMIWQMHEFLVKGKVDCDLYDICSNSKPDIVDERCLTAPWERVHDQQKCPYAAAMIQWGLSHKNLVIGGVTVDTTP